MKGMLTPEEQLKVLSKICGDCEESKPLDHYTRRARGDYFNICKPCRATRQAIKRGEDPHFKRQSFMSRMRRKYGLTEIGWDQLILESEGRCMICDKPEKMLHVDHDHDTGEVRGLLCYPCNSLIGLAKDDVKILASAIEYLGEE